MCVPPEPEHQAVAATQAELALGPGQADGSQQCRLLLLPCPQAKMIPVSPGTHWEFHIPPPAPDMHEVSSKLIVNNLKNLSLEVPV